MQGGRVTLQRARETSFWARGDWKRTTGNFGRRSIAAGCVVLPLIVLALTQSGCASDSQQDRGLEPTSSSAAVQTTVQSTTTAGPPQSFAKEKGLAPEEREFIAQLMIQTIEIMGLNSATLAVSDPTAVFNGDLSGIDPAPLEQGIAHTQSALEAFRTDLPPTPRLGSLYAAHSVYLQHVIQAYTSALETIESGDPKRIVLASLADGALAEEAGDILNICRTRLDQDTNK